MPKALPDRPRFTHFQRTVTGVPIAIPNAAYTDYSGHTVPFAKRCGEYLRPPPARVGHPELSAQESKKQRRAEFREQQPQCQEAFRARVQERDNARDEAARQQECDRILAGPSAQTLLQRLAEQPPMHTPIAPKASIDIDFAKHMPTELANIFAPKFAAVHKWLEVFEGDDIFVFDSDNLTNEERNVKRLIARLKFIAETLKEKCSKIEYRKWKVYDAGCQEIGDISFKQLRRNLVRVVHALSAVYVNGYFD